MKDVVVVKGFGVVVCMVGVNSVNLFGNSLFVAVGVLQNWVAVAVVGNISVVVIANFVRKLVGKLGEDSSYENHCQKNYVLWGMEEMVCMYFLPTGRKRRMKREHWRDSKEVLN